MTKHLTNHHNDTPSNSPRTTPHASNNITPNENSTNAPCYTPGNQSDTDSDAHDVDSDTPPLQIPTDATEVLEPWVEWIRRSTHDAEQQMITLGIEDWVTIQRRRKWRWASRVALATDDKWITKAIEWDPLLDSRQNPRRRQGRPQKRWTDDIAEHVRQHLQQSHARAAETPRDDNTHKTNTNHNDNDDHFDGIRTNDEQHNNDDERISWMTTAKNSALWNRLEDQYVHRHAQDDPMPGPILQ